MTEKLEEERVYKQQPSPQDIVCATLYEILAARFEKEQKIERKVYFQRCGQLFKFPKERSKWLLLLLTEKYGVEANQHFIWFTDKVPSPMAH